MFAQLWERFGPMAFTEWVALFAPRAIAGLLVVIVGLLVWWLTRRTIRIVQVRADLDATLVKFFETIARYVIATIAIVTALGELGVNVSSILGSLGVVGLTVGFAARDTLSNLISGLFILWDRPFVIGDLIEIDGKYGRVDNITLRTTRVVTVDGKMLAIPNSVIVNTTVASYTNFPHLRIDVDATLGVEEDLNRCREIFHSVVADEAGLLASPAPEMVVTSLNDYNIAVQFRAWVEDETRHLAARSSLREKLFEALRAAKVDMPFETIRLAPPIAVSLTATA